MTQAARRITARTVKRDTSPRIADLYVSDAGATAMKRLAQAQFLPDALVYVGILACIAVVEMGAVSIGIWLATH